jgi:hypothetical protein
VRGASTVCRDGETKKRVRIPEMGPVTERLARVRRARRVAQGLQRGCLSGESNDQGGSLWPIRHEKNAATMAAI